MDYDHPVVEVGRAYVPVERRLERPPLRGPALPDRPHPGGLARDRHMLGIADLIARPLLWLEEAGRIELVRVLLHLHPHEDAAGRRKVSAVVHARRVVAADLEAVLRRGDLVPAFRDLDGPAARVVLDTHVAGRGGPGDGERLGRRRDLPAPRSRHEQVYLSSA